MQAVIRVSVEKTKDKKMNSKLQWKIYCSKSLFHFATCISDIKKEHRSVDFFYSVLWIGSTRLFSSLPLAAGSASSVLACRLLIITALCTVDRTSDRVSGHTLRVFVTSSEQVFFYIF